MRTAKFQNFNAPEPTGVGTARVTALRQRMATLGIAAVLVPRADEHQGEYVPPSANRLRWLTGFSGSAGRAIVTAGAAALFVDGRYIAQAPREVDPSVFEILEAPQNEPSTWLGGKLAAGAVIGFDPWLHTIAEIEALEEALAGQNFTIKPLARNLVDVVWGRDRPPPPKGAVIPHPQALAGRSSQDKIAEIQSLLAERGQDATILTAPDSICWLLNIRGTDVAHNPVALAFAVLPRTGKVQLFIDPAKIGDNVAGHIRAVADVQAPDALAATVAALRKDGRRVRLDPASAAWWFKRALGASAKVIVRGADPCVLPKARKTAAELSGARAAHERDGVAVARFLAWLDREAPLGNVDEIGAAQKLEAFRAATGALKEISFDTISGAGANAAIVHYRVTEATNRRLQPGELYLTDSGGQYEDGTTDITRTIAIGIPDDAMRRHFTLVLKGHIAVAAARFPKATPGMQIDAFARHAMWMAGLDFDHGTGHGVGSYLSVHEGPQSISRRGMAALEPGMICSNEPGYYQRGAYGIRIENLVIVTPPAAIKGGEREMLGFETITLAPYDRRLIDVDMLTADERAWVNAYHARVARIIGPKLSAQDRAWMKAATASLS